MKRPSTKDIVRKWKAAVVMPPSTSLRCEICEDCRRKATDALRQTLRAWLGLWKQIQAIYGPDNRAGERDEASLRALHEGQRVLIESLPRAARVMLSMERTFFLDGVILSWGEFDGLWQLVARPAHDLSRQESSNVYPLLSTSKEA